MDTRVYVIGHRQPDTDSICSAIAYAHLQNQIGNPHVRPARAGEINAETAFVLSAFDTPVPELLTDAAGRDLILVDHNEVAQALPHIEQAHVREIWEHHRLGDLHTPEPILVHCEPVGATATLIAEQYAAHRVEPTRAMAGLMLASILSDTVCFRSPTTTAKDHAVASRLQPLAGVDLEAFGRRLLESRTAGIEKKPAAALVGEDFKEFRIGALRVGIGQVEVTRPGALASRKPAILREMRARRERDRLAQGHPDDHRRGAQASDLWVVGDRLDAIEQAFGPLEEHAVHVPGCMSRKKQVVPRVEAALVDGGTTRLAHVSQRRRNNLIP